MDFSTYKFSPTSLVKIMSNSRAILSQSGAKDLERIEKKQIQGKPLSEKDINMLPRLIMQREKSAKNELVLSVGCEKYLMGIYLNEKYGKRYKLLSPDTGTGVTQMIRGIKTEGQGLALLSEIDNVQYFKYKKIVENDYLVGKLDVINAESLEKATKIFDIKSSSDPVSFFSKKDEPFTDENINQMQAYFAITGISEGEIVHCLVGEPKEVIEEQEELLFKKMCPDGIKTDKFVKSWDEALKNMTYADIPPTDRLIGLPVYRDDDYINLIYETIEECRRWLNRYHEEHTSFASQRYFEQKNNSKHNPSNLG